MQKREGERGRVCVCTEGDREGGGRESVRVCKRGREIEREGEREREGGRESVCEEKREIEREGERERACVQ